MFVVRVFKALWINEGVFRRKRVNSKRYILLRNPDKGYFILRRHSRKYIVDVYVTLRVLYVTIIISIRKYRRALNYYRRC